MRHSSLTRLLILAASLAVAVAATGAAGAASGDPVVAADRGSAGSGEVLSIENAQGAVRITGRGYLNMRVTQGAVTVVDQTPTDRFSPYLGGIPRGRSSGIAGRDINLYVLGGRYKVIVRGSGINISARGDGSVQITGQLDATGTAGTIRIGDLVRPIAEGESKATFGGSSTSEGAVAPGASSPSSGSSGSSSSSGGGRS